MMQLSVDHIISYSLDPTHLTVRPSAEREREQPIRAAARETETVRDTDRGTHTHTTASPKSRLLQVKR
jgi:hypothetical protein